MADHTLTDVKGVGAKTAAGLTALGIDSIEMLDAAPSELIATLPGFSVNRADAVKAAARELRTTGRHPSRESAAKPKPAAKGEKQKPGTEADAAARKKPRKAKQNTESKEDARTDKKRRKKSAKKTGKKASTKKTGKKAAKKSSKKSSRKSPKISDDKKSDRKSGTKKTGKKKKKAKKK